MGLAKAFEKRLGASSNEGEEACLTPKRRWLESEAVNLVPSPAPTPAPSTPQAPTKVPVSNASSSARPTPPPPPMEEWSTAYKTKIHGMKVRIEEMRKAGQRLLATVKEQAAEIKRLKERLAQEEEKRRAVEGALEAALEAKTQMAKSLEKWGELRNKLFREALVSSVVKKQAFQQSLKLYELALGWASERIGSHEDVLGALHAGAQYMYNNPPSFKSGESMDEEPGVEVSSHHGSTDGCLM